MKHRGAVAAWMYAVGLTMLGWVGCGPGGWMNNSPRQASATQPADGATPAAHAADNPFGPPTPPDSFDPVQARLSLAQLPDEPATPARVTTRPTALSDAGLRFLKEARRLFAEQRYSETVIEAEKAIRYESNNAEGHRLIALASLLSGNDSRARASADKALTIDPGCLPCYYVLGRSAEKSDRKPEAIRTYRTALKCEGLEEDRSYKALTHYYLGNLLFAQGLYTAAAGQLEAFENELIPLGEKLADNPELATIARVHRGEAAMTAARARGYLGQYAAAADDLKTVLPRVTNDFDLRAEYVRMLVRAKRTDAATQEAAQLLADSKGSSDSVQLLVAVHAASGHPDRALATIKSVVAHQPDSVELWLVYVDTLWSSDRKTEAFTAVRDLLARHPESSAARWKLIELERRREDWPGWATQLTEAVANEPAQHARAAQQIEQIPTNQIESLLERLEKSPPAASQPADKLASARDFVRGHLLERLDRVDEARKAYDAALTRTPDFLPVALSAGELYLNRCRWKDAIDSLEALQKSRTEPSAQLEFFLGRACDGLDQTTEAISHFTRAAQLDRNHLPAMLALARLHERIGNGSAAQRQYESILAADASCMAAKEGMIRLLLPQTMNRSDPREQQAAFGRLMTSLSEMQKMAPQDPATLRCAALVQFASSRDQKTYIETLRKLLKQFPGEQRTREDLVRALLDTRDYQPAQELLHEWLSRDRCSATGQEMLALAQIRTLQFDDAARGYEQMLEMYPNRQLWIAQYAEVASLMQQYDRAIELYNRFLHLSTIEGKPERELAYRERLLQVYRRAKRFDEVRELAAKWLADAQEEQFRSRYRLMLLITDLVARDYDTYLARCRAWLKDDPKSPELNHYWLLGLTKAEQHDLAMAAGLQWMAANPDESRLDQVAERLEGARLFPGAIEIRRGLLAAAPEKEKRARLLSLAKLYLAAKDYNHAIVSLKQLILQTQSASTEDDVFDYQQMVAQAYVKGGRPEEAARFITKTMNDLDEEVRQTIDDIERKYQQRVEGADSQDVKKKLIDELERIKKMLADSVKPHKAELLKQMYWAYQKQGQLDVAEQRLREALALAPGDPGICNDLGYTLADTGTKLQEARRLTTLAVGEEPTTAAYLDSYGWVLYKLGEFEQARRWLRWASGLEGGEDAVIYDHMGDAQWCTGDKEAAKTSWKRSLEINERQEKEGDDSPEKDLPDRVRRKLQAVKAGEAPAVAPTAASSQPAGA